MPILEADDPIAILHDQFQALLNKQDGHSAIAALALTLSAVLALAASKQLGPEAPMVSDMRAELLDLAVCMVRARAAQSCES